MSETKSEDARVSELPCVLCDKMEPVCQYEYQPGYFCRHNAQRHNKRGVLHAFVPPIEAAPEPVSELSLYPPVDPQHAMHCTADCDGWLDAIRTFSASHGVTDPKILIEEFLAAEEEVTSLRASIREAWPHLTGHCLEGATPECFAAMRAALSRNFKRDPLPYSDEAQRHG